MDLKKLEAKIRNEKGTFKDAHDYASACGKEASKELRKQLDSEFPNGGITEEDAVTAGGFPEQIARQANAEAPTTLPQKRRLKAREIVLLILGSPLWLSLGIAAVAVILSLYVSLWAVAIALWAVFGSLIACAFGGVLAGAGFIVGGHLFSGIAMIGGGIVCAGLSIFAFYGCKAAAKGLVMLTKRCFVKKVGVA